MDSEPLGKIRAYEKNTTYYEQRGRGGKKRANLRLVGSKGSGKKDLKILPTDGILEALGKKRATRSKKC